MQPKPNQPASTPGSGAVTLICPSPPTWLLMVRIMCWKRPEAVLLSTFRISASALAALIILPCSAAVGAAPIREGTALAGRCCHRQDQCLATCTMRLTFTWPTCRPPTTPPCSCCRAATLSQPPPPTYSDHTALPPPHHPHLLAAVVVVCRLLQVLHAGTCHQRQLLQHRKVQLARRLRRDRWTGQLGIQSQSSWYQGCGWHVAHGSRQQGSCVAQQQPLHRQSACMRPQESLQTAGMAWVQRRRNPTGRACPSHLRHVDSQALERVGALLGGGAQRVHGRLRGHVV